MEKQPTWYGSRLSTRFPPASLAVLEANPTQTQATRFPQDTFAAVKLLLGHPASHPSAQLHQSLYSLPLGSTPRGSPTVASSSATYSVEEVLAMQLAYAKEMADEAAGESVRDVVVTVPGWFAQSERQAVLDAVELAGLRSIGLVNDGAAGEFRGTLRCPPTSSRR